jgi:cytochrome c553
MRTSKLALYCVSACAIGAAMPATTLADNEIYPLTNAAYRNECGSCHVPYPPALLDAQAWKRIMDRLDQHFGSDASVDARIADEIRTYLVSSAGRKATMPASKGLPRITEARWFVREHDEVPASLWKSEAVRSPASCGACHTRAEQGDYSERTPRLPK